MSHAALLFIGPGAAFDEDGLPDSTADFISRECPRHGEYERPVYEEDQTCDRPECDLIGAEL